MLYMPKVSCYNISAERDLKKNLGNCGACLWAIVQDGYLNVRKEVCLKGLMFIDILMTGKFLARAISNQMGVVVSVLISGHSVCPFKGEHPATCGHRHLLR